MVVALPWSKQHTHAGYARAKVFGGLEKRCIEAIISAEIAAANVHAVGLRQR